MLEIIRRNVAFFLMIFLLGVIPGLLDIILYGIQGAVLIKSLCIIGYVFLLSYIVVLCLTKILKVGWFKYLFVGVWLFCFWIEVILLLGYETLISPSIAFVALNTNQSEIIEYFSSVSTLSNCIFVGIFLVVSLFTLWGISHIKLSSFRYSKLCSGLLMGILLLGGIVWIYTLYKFPSVFSYRVVTPVERLYYSVNQSIQDLKEMEKALINNSLDTTELLENNSEVQNIIMILGESLSRTKMGCYGYYLNTTPCLEKRMDEGNLLLFTDVITPYGVTGDAVKHLMTSYRVGDSAKWENCDILPNVMEKAGYTTYWLSNQESFGIFASMPVAIANQFDVVKFTRVRNSLEERYNVFDEDLFPLVQEALTDSAKKRFIVIHLMGSHTRYLYRYPKSMAFFTKTDIKGKSGSEAKIISEYNNSVLYSDWVVDSLLHMFDGKDALAFFLSDHGEEIYDFRPYVGHGVVKSSRYTAEIPFMIWYSDIFERKYPNKIDKMKRATERKFMTDDFYSALLDLVDIKTAYSDSTRSLFNSDFDDNRLRLFNGKIDYDMELKNKN